MLLKLFKLRLIQACICLCFVILCPFVDVFYAKLFYIRKPVLWMFLNSPALFFELNPFARKALAACTFWIRQCSNEVQLFISAALTK